MRIRRAATRLRCSPLFQCCRVSNAPVWHLPALAHQVCYSSPRATSSCNRTTAPTSSGSLCCSTHPRHRRKPGVWARRRPTTVRDSVPQACNEETGTYVMPRMSACEVGYKRLACCSSQDFMPKMTLYANEHVARTRVPSRYIELVKNIFVGFPRDVSDIWPSQKKYKEIAARDRVVGKMMRSETSVR
ncbi:hypothetical protein B0H14DRAFT_2844229 [Mycena olivaceomarginata]|nr:hypothetical protein B0H14DRAFT_2844229 [Mycena olivaceomarginata]